MSHITALAIRLLALRLVLVILPLARRLTLTSAAGSLAPQLVLAMVALVLATGAVRAGASAAPADWPTTVQVSSPSIGSASPDLLDHPDFPALAGIAWDERLRSDANDRSITLNLTGLGFVQALRLAGGHRDVTADSSGLLGRAAARIALGGPLQYEQGPQAERAGRPTNHVTSEIKLRLRGGEAGADTARETRLALALDADNVATGYGLDRYGATFIAERPGPCAAIANVGYRIVERYKSPIRLAEAKLGLGLEYRLFARSAQARAADLGFAGACLLRNHGRAAVWQGSARLDAPLPGGLRIGFGVCRSTQPELPGLDRTRCVLSVAYDLGRPGH